VIRGDYGGRASRSTTYDFEITSWPMVLELLADNEAVRTAAKKVIAAMVRAHQRQIAGVRVFPVGKLNVG